MISGGVRLNDLKWEPYKDGIMQAKVPAGFATDQLFVNGQRQPMARYPNFDPQRAGSSTAGRRTPSARSGRRAGKTRPAGSSMPCTPPSGAACTMSSPARAPDNKITYEGGWQNNRPMGMHDSRFVENIFEELDAPGEWFLNRKTGTLYFYPPAALIWTRRRSKAFACGI